MNLSRSFSYIKLLLIICFGMFFYLSTADDIFTLVIDAGHGGKDPGAINGKSQEKSINLNVALKAGKLIEDNCKDVKVIYTRKNDTFVELYKRADIANKANANLFISIHTNSAKSSAAYGTETYLLGVEENRTSANFNVAIEENKAILLENDYEAHYEGYDPNSPESQIIFEFMQNEYQKESLKMASIVQNTFTNTAKRYNRGVHQAGYLVLWKSAMPSILIELGFISNTNEMKYMTSQKGVDELSSCIYQAFNNYLSESRKHLTQTAAINESSKEAEISNNSNDSPLFKVQFLTSNKKIPLSDKRFAGLTNVEEVKDGQLYKYTCGSTTNYEDAKKTKNNISSKYKDSFIIATEKGVRIDLQKAINKMKNK